MAGRTTGRQAVLYLSEEVGAPLTNKELTLASTKTINGITYTDRFYGYSNAIFDRSQPISIIIQGIVGSLNIISGNDNNDEVQTSAFQYYKDGGSIQTVPADTSVSLTRPASGKYAWNLITVNTGTNAITATKGLDGDAYSDTFGAAGGPPLVGTDEIIIGAVKLYSNTSAKITAEDIFYTDSAGVLLQERSHTNYEIHPVEGGVLLGAALGKFHTGSVGRKVFASFYNMAPFLLKQIHIESMSIAGSRNVATAEAMEDIFAASELAGAPTATGSISRFYNADDTLFRLAFERGYGVFKIYPNYQTDPGKYYMFCAYITSWDHPISVGDFQKNSLNFTIDGAIKKVGF